MDYDIPLDAISGLLPDIAALHSRGDTEAFVPGTPDQYFNTNPPLHV